MTPREKHLISLARSVSKFLTAQTNEKEYHLISKLYRAVYLLEMAAGTARAADISIQREREENNPTILPTQGYLW